MFIRCLLVDGESATIVVAHLAKVDNNMAKNNLPTPKPPEKYDYELLFGPEKGKKQKQAVAFDYRRRISYVKMVAQGGRLNDSAMALGVSPQTVRNWREKDPEFDEAVETAKLIYQDHLERTIYKRAVEGWDEPVFYQGQQVGTVRKYSDRLLELEVKRHIPEYRDHQTIDATVKAGVMVVPAKPKTKEEWAEAYGGAPERIEVDE